jgi:hypothetical protein
MTRRNYVRIAAALRNARPFDYEPAVHYLAVADAFPGSSVGARLVSGRDGWHRAVECIAYALANDNPRFDIARFRTAAGCADLHA